MRLTNHYRNEFKRLCGSDQTIDRVTSGLDNFGVSLNIFSQMCGRRYWSHVWKKNYNGYGCPITGRTAGKGNSLSLSVASGVSEFAERFQSSFFYRESQSKENMIIEDFVSDKYCDYFKILSNLDLFDTRSDAFSLNNQKYYSVPIEMLHLLNGSNGLASGNSLEESIIQGSCEIFERYTMSKSILEKKIVPTIQINTIKNEQILNFIDILRQKNIEVYIKDLSYGLFPSVGVLFYNRNVENDSNYFKRIFTLTLECGSSFFFEEAISRCFNEYVQGENSLEEIAFRFIQEQTLKDFEKEFPEIVPRLPDNLWLQFRCGLYSLDLSHLMDDSVIVDHVPEVFYSGSILEDIEKISGIAIKLKSDVLVLDMTDDIVNFPTVRVIIPRFSDLIVFGNPLLRIIDKPSALKFEDNDHYCWIKSLTIDIVKELNIFSSLKERDNVLSLDIKAIKRYVMHSTNIRKLFNIDVSEMSAQEIDNFRIMKFYESKI